MRLFIVVVTADRFHEIFGQFLKVLTELTFKLEFKFTFFSIPIPTVPKSLMTSQLDDGQQTLWKIKV